MSKMLIPHMKRAERYRIARDAGIQGIHRISIFPRFASRTWCFLDSFSIEKNFSKIVRTKDKATKNDPQPPSDLLGPTETILNFNPTEESKQNTRSIM
jgi:hypothetical protein